MGVHYLESRFRATAPLILYDVKPPHVYLRGSHEKALRTELLLSGMRYLNTNDVMRQLQSITQS